MTDKLLTINEVADITRTSVETCRHWRKHGTGPKSFRLGRRVVYREQDVTAWITAAAAEAG